MPSKFVEEYEKYGMKYLEEAEVLMAMTSMFGSCVAQAQNQGENQNMNGYHLTRALLFE